MLPPSRVYQADDGAAVFEWYKPDRRFAIFIERDVTDSSWCYVQKNDGDGPIMLGAVFPPDMIQALKTFLEGEE